MLRVWGLGFRVQGSGVQGFRGSGVHSKLRILPPKPQTLGVWGSGYWA